MATRPSTCFQLRHFVQLPQHLNALNQLSSSPPFHHLNPFQSTHPTNYPTNSSGCLYRKTYQATPILAHHQCQDGRHHLIYPMMNRMLYNSSGVKLLKCTSTIFTSLENIKKYKNKKTKQKLFYSKHGIQPTEIIPRLFFCINFFNTTSHNFIFFF
jgi:hypothetical protein